MHVACITKAMLQSVCFSSMLWLCKGAGHAQHIYVAKTGALDLFWLDKKRLALCTANELQHRPFGLIAARDAASF